MSLGEGFTPLIHASRLGARLDLSRLYVKDESLNPTNSFKARGLSAAITRARSLGAHTVSVPSAGNAGCATAAYAARAGIGGARVSAARRQGGLRPRVPVLRRVGDARRRAHHRRGTNRRRAGRRARLVRRVHVEGAVSHRRQENDGLRAGRAARLAAARLDPLSDGRRNGPHRHVEGLRRNGAPRLDRSPPAREWSRFRPQAARPSCARSRAAPSGRRRGKKPRRWPMACVCREPSATF